MTCDLNQIRKATREAKSIALGLIADIKEKGSKPRDIRRAQMDLLDKITGIRQYDILVNGIALQKLKDKFGDYTKDYDE
jgi:hypothetical protein